MVRVDYQKLFDMVEQCYEKVGVSEEEAKLITSIQLQADQRGVHSHGIAALGRYVGLFERNEMKKAEEHQVVEDRGAVEVWDALRSNGMVTAARAMQAAIDKAKQYGIGAVGVRHANHLGAGAYYSLMAKDQGMIGVALSTGGPTMAPWGGAEKAIGNNPLAMSVPANEVYPLTLDMAQSVVAYGRVMNLKKQGEKEIPAGWGLDRNGLPTTDINEFYSVMPTGAYKGFGSSLMIDVLAGLLFEGGVGAKADDDADGCSFFMLAINVDFFTDPEAFRNRVDERVKELKSVRPAANSRGIFMPGEIEEMKYAASLEKVEVIPENLADANAVAERLGLAPAEAEA